MKAIVVAGLLLAACFSTSSALKCYSCVFPSDTNCQEGKNIQEQDCGEISTIEKTTGFKNVCLKSVIDIQGVKQVTRSCSKQQGDKYNPCLITNGKIDHCSVCETDLCNSANKIITSIMSLIFAFFMAFY